MNTGTDERMHYTYYYRERLHNTLKLTLTLLTCHDNKIGGQNHAKPRPYTYTTHVTLSSHCAASAKDRALGGKLNIHNDTLFMVRRPYAMSRTMRKQV